MTPQADAELAALVEALQASLGEVRAKSARLEQALTEARDQQAATGEILRVISRSPADLHPVLETVAASAARLCESIDAAIYRPDGDRLLLVARHGAMPGGTLGEFSLPLVRGTASGRALLDGLTVHVADLSAADAEFPESVESARSHGVRAILCVPLMRGSSPVGVISLRRTEPELFTQRQVTLLETFADQAVVDRRTIHVHDLAEESKSEYPISRAAQQQISHRTTLATPLLREGVALGAILIRRMEVSPFSEKQIKLLETFADQAVIAIENVRLFTELEVRNGELRVALEQQTATSEVLKVIGRSTFDVQPVFETLAEHAVRLCEAERGLIFRFDGQFLRFTVGHNVSPALVEFFAQNPMAPGRGSNAGRAALERRTVHNHDVLSDPEYSYGGYRVDPYRTVLAIPMLRADELLRVILIYRHEVRPFTDGQVTLMETFADQAAIAIENARLLSQLPTKNSDLTVALEQQTATSEILRVISSSPQDGQPES